MIWLSTQRIYIVDNTTILDICRLSHGSCFVYYSPELLPSRNPSTTVLHTGLTTSVEGGVSSFELCPGIRLVTTRVASIGKSFEIDDAHLGQNMEKFK